MLGLQLKSGVAPQGHEFSNLLMLSAAEHTAATPTGALALYRTTTAVSVPVNKIADAISQIRPLYKTNGVIDEGDEINRLLQNPGADWPTDLFVKTLVTDYSAAGNAFIWASGQRGVPVIMAPISPIDVNRNTDGHNSIESFQISIGSYKGVYKRVLDRGQTRYLSAETNSELYHIRDYTTRTGDRTYGESRLVSAGSALRQIILGAEHNTALIANGGVMSQLFTLKGRMSPEQFDFAKQEIIDNYAGSTKAGKIGVVNSDDVNVQEFGLTAKDMNYAELETRATRAVANLYDIPFVLIDNEQSTFNNLDSAVDQFFDNAVVPTAKTIYNAFERLLVGRQAFDRANSEIGFDPLQVPALRRRIVEEIKLRREANIETTNELRGSIAREPLDGGDVLMASATLVPVATDTTVDDVPVLPDNDDDVRD